jgi:hypothetical protein
MKKLILLILLFVLSAPVAWAQQANANVVVNQVTEESDNSLFITDEEEEIGLFLSDSFISGLQQLAADANQVARINTVGSNNVSQLTQSGNGNIGAINVLGNGNETSLNQNGNDLISVLNLEGDFNILDVDQIGSNLQNVVQLEGDGLNFDILQDAQGLQLTQTGSGIPLQIETTGGTVPIIITNN